MTNCNFHKEQAYSFLDWHDRIGGDMKSRFDFWAHSKDFWPEDKKKIWQEILKANYKIDAVYQEQAKGETA